MLQEQILAEQGTQSAIRFASTILTYRPTKPSLPGLSETTDSSETRWVANEHPALWTVHSDKPFNFSQKAYLLPLGNDEFQEYVNQWLNMAKNDGTLDAAEKPWFG